MLVALGLQIPFALHPHRTMPPQESPDHTGGKQVSMPAANNRNAVQTCLLVTALLTTYGCSRKTSVAKPPPPLTVEVTEVIRKDVPIYREWIGTLDGLVNADIKAEVTGYLIQQAYTEGTFVRKGQLLFLIDPRPFQAALDQAQGRL